MPRIATRAAGSIAAGLCALALAGCGGDSEPAEVADPKPVPPTTETEPGAEEPADTTDEGRAGDRPGESEPPRGKSDQRLVLETIRAYARALTRRDGERLCELLTPGAFAILDPPRNRVGCAATLEASIGYEDPRGLPVFESTRFLRGDESISIEGDTARVTATGVTEFSDRELPSVEDDVVHLVRRAGRWRVAKPSVLLYRAIGVADLPADVLTPP